MNGSDSSKQTSANAMGVAALAIPVMLLLGLFSYYMVVFLKYRPYDIDNPWFLSFSYNACTEHIDSDQFMNMRFPAGMDGTLLFGKLASITQCTLLSHVAWQQRPAAVLSAAMVVLALGFWWLLLRKVGHSRAFASSFVLAAGLSEPLLSAANKFRYEFFSFALISFGLLLVAYGKPMLGVFLAGLAFETEPLALAGLIPALVLACYPRKPSPSVIARLVIGIACSLAVYFALHPIAIHIGSYLTQVRTGGGDGGAFGAYFIRRPRHLPELALFAIAAAVYWRRRSSIQNHSIAISALLLTVFTLVMPHGNAAYMIFTYPFLIAMAMISFGSETRPWATVVVALLLFVPQQLYLLRITRNLAIRQTDIADVSQAIQRAERQLNLADANTRIYGDYRLWFAHPGFYRAASESTRTNIGDADLYLCFDRSPGPAALEPAWTLFCPAIEAAIPLRRINTLSIHNTQLNLYARR